jgi:hypothetical protein
MWNNEITPFDIIGLMGFIGFYIVVKVWVYSKEYDTKENKKDIVIRRGTEWDYKRKDETNTKDSKKNTNK